MRVCACAVSALLCVATRSAGGQVPDTLAADSVRKLGPVRVQAGRIAGAPALAPFAVTVRTTEALPKGTPALALDEALRGIPGVQIDNRYNFALGERIVMRGSGARAQFGVRGVRVLIDGIPATLPDGQTTLNQVDLSRIGRVEALRGPMAALYGNASGGAILLETATPPVDRVQGSVTVLAGANGLHRLAASAGGTRHPLAYGAAISRVGYTGFRTHSRATNHYGTARLSWLGRRDHVRVLVNAVEYEALNPGSLSDSLLRVDRHQAFRGNIAQRTGERGAQQQAGVTWQRALASRHHLDVTSWGILRTIDNPIPGRVVVIDRAAGGARAIVRGEYGRAAWTAGVEHERQRDDRQNYANEAGDHGDLLLDQLERVTGTGAFAQGSVAPHPRVHLLVGARLDRTRFQARDRFTTGDPDDSGTRSLGAVSPSAGISLVLEGGFVAYGNAGTAFETPTTTELVNRPSGAGGFNPVLEPQRTLSYEAGLRRQGARASVHLAAFRALTRDALIPFEVPDAPGRQFFRNAGRTSTSGVEAAATVALGRDVKLDAAYTLTNARFREYTVGTASHAGNRIPGVAPHRADLSATLRRAAGFAAADLRVQSRMAVNDANTAHSASHVLADLRLGSRPVRIGEAHATLTAGVQNVLAAEYNTSVVVNAFGRRFYEPGPGRTLHVGATLVASPP